jgi:hypothetical protein
MNFSQYKKEQQRMHSAKFSLTRMDDFVCHFGSIFRTFSSDNYFRNSMMHSELENFGKAVSIEHLYQKMKTAYNDSAAVTDLELGQVSGSGTGFRFTDSRGALCGNREWYGCHIFTCLERSRFQTTADLGETCIRTEDFPSPVAAAPKTLYLMLQELSPSRREEKKPVQQHVTTMATRSSEMNPQFLQHQLWWL